MHTWADEFDAPITICDRDGVVVYMNEASKKQFHKSGGGDLIGESLLDCHPEPSRSMLKKMLEKPTRNLYTVEKHGVTKQIIQTPWMENGDFKGIIEMSFILPSNMMHRKRD